MKEAYCEYLKTTINIWAKDVFTGKVVFDQETENKFKDELKFVVGLFEADNTLINPRPSHYNLNL